jgi:hypothetical protein
MLRHACGYALANAGHDTTRSGLARPPIDPAHDALHAIERGAVQGLLEVKRVAASNFFALFGLQKPGGHV